MYPYSLDQILTAGNQGAASDIHLKVGLPPMFRIAGGLVALKGAPRLSPQDMSELAAVTMNEKQQREFDDQREIDLAYSVAGVGRFRVNIFHQRGSVGMAVRVIRTKVPTLKELLMPKSMEKIAVIERGLILVTGTTSSGKSSTLAAIIDYINTNLTKHILTIEDPIEFMIRDKRSMINQRELGLDTLAYTRALKSALREDPDVILIGELRDLSTVEIALAAAETGHLVMSTLHTMDAPETITRVISLFPPHQQRAVRLQLAAILKAVISQRLVPRADGKGRVPAVEIMIVNTRIRELIEDEEQFSELNETISNSFESYGMQTFDQSLMGLVKSKLITYAEAMRQATNPADFELRFKGIESSGGSWGNFATDDPFAEDDKKDDDL